MISQIKIVGAVYSKIINIPSGHGADDFLILDIAFLIAKLSPNFSFNLTYFAVSSYLLKGRSWKSKFFFLQSLLLQFDQDFWSKHLKQAFKFQVKVWSWSLRLGSISTLWLILKLRFEVWYLSFTSGLDISVLHLTFNV